jgi:molybdopterin-biosynthesis enzyme MoeA-like protein
MNLGADWHGAEFDALISSQPICGPTGSNIGISRYRSPAHFGCLNSTPQAIMITANAPAPKEVAALLVIGDKILSGRTKDKNIGYIAEYLTAARMRMTRIPKGADLVLNEVSGAPGFWIGNVIVMAGVPSIMQAMLDEVAPKLKTGIRMLSETIRANVRESDISTQLDEIAKANPGVVIGSHPFFDPQLGPSTTAVLRASDAQRLLRAKRAVEDMMERVQGAQSGIT